MSTYILAHDLGTSGDKATLFDREGRAVATSVGEYETDYPRPGWAEQDAADWWRAVRESTRGLLERAQAAPGEVAVVSFSGMMNGALAVDAAGQPLRPAIIWADQRATEEADRLAERCGTEAVYRTTGHRPGAVYSAAKVLWIKRNQPDLYRKTARFLQVKDYAAWRLTGEFATDYSDASSTNLYDLEGHRWAEDIAGAVGLDIGKFPPLRASDTVIGRVTADAARATGLAEGTPVVIGGGDGACATVGAGSVQPGDAYNCLGSSSWIAVTARRPLYDPEMRTFTFAHLDPELYFPTGTMQSAGGSLDWLEGLLRGDGEEGLHEQLCDAAAEAPPGAQGLLFLPYLMGERSPWWNPLARGAFVGLTRAHGRAEVARAVLEGVALNLRIILDALRGQGIEIDRMRLIGGGAQNAAWRQILADVYGLPLLRPARTREATALGAAVAGGVGVGIFEDFDAAREIVRMEPCETPDPERRRAYAPLYELFCEAYQSLEPIFNRLADQ
ncbi:MAG: xylulokinase [Planctomycetota bacterium]